MPKIKIVGGLVKGLAFISIGFTSCFISYPYLSKFEFVRNIPQFGTNISNNGENNIINNGSSYFEKIDWEYENGAVIPGLVKGKKENVYYGRPFGRDTKLWIDMFDDRIEWYKPRDKSE